MVATRIKEVMPSVTERNRFYLSNAWPMVREAVNRGEWFMMEKTKSGLLIEIYASQAI